MRRLLRLALGSFLMLVGLAGLVLPFVQGWLFLGLGMICLSQDVPLFARMEEWVAGRFPTVGLSLKRMKRLLPS